MKTLTQLDRQAGRKAMESSLSPLQRALRKFASGKPHATPRNTPLGAVTLVTAQRTRLAGILAKEPGLEKPLITSAAVVVRILRATPAPGGALADTVLVEEGKEGQALACLETYESRFNVEIAIAGLLFAILEGGKKWPFAYLIERTPESVEAMQWSFERQISGVLKRSDS